LSPAPRQEHACRDRGSRSTLALHHDRSFLRHFIHAIEQLRQWDQGRAADPSIAPLREPADIEQEHAVTIGREVARIDLRHRAE
jgi:hypothetical protein